MAGFKWRMARFVAVALGGFALSACGEKVSWNQKITINVETPDGVKSGSSVTRVEKFDKAWFGIDAITPPEARGVGTRVKGEAVVVDLGDGKYLFGLLGSGGTAQCAIDWEADKWWPEGARNLSRHRGAVALEDRCQPRLVTFEDIDDPASVKRVEPDALAASFGNGYALQSMTLEITRERVTRGRIEQLISWYSGYPEPGLCPATGRSTDIPFCRRVNHGDIIRE
ncbi:MAG: hypothetical protein AAGG69_15080 [Pseudomonadota bacterium]